MAEPVRLSAGTDREVVFTVDTGRGYDVRGCITVDQKAVDIVFARADGKPFTGGGFSAPEYSVAILIDDELT